MPYLQWGEVAVGLPFGARHAASTATLENMAPSRLAKNAKLQRQLAAQRSDAWARTDSGLLVKNMALSFDSAKLEVYFAYAVRGLLWHHWSVHLPEDSFVQPMCITAAGERVIEHQLSLNARARVCESLGDGAIDYRGAQGVDRPDMSVWHFKLNGGIALAGDPQAPNEAATSVGVFTAPRRVALKAKWRAGEGGLRVEALIPPAVHPRTTLPVIGAAWNRF